MADDAMVELHGQLRTAQDKYTYFLLAAAASGIGLAANQTATRILAWSMIPLGLGVICWGLGFFFGCRHLQYVNSTLYANYELLRVQKGEHPDAGTHPRAIAAASEGIREAIQDNIKRASRLAWLQFDFLVLGAILYIAWHILEMALRTLGQGPSV